jgi:D-alanyl-D-alanine carboxypeptidase (penicillin-binding protein 5/6)
LTALLAALVATFPVAAQPAKAPADRLDGPPHVTAKAWAVADGKTGKLLWGFKEAEPRPIASTTKVMTAWVVLQLASDGKALDEEVTFSKRAAETRGSSSRLRAGDKLPVRELLYGLLLPSGNDAAAALAEHFGPRLKAESKEEDAVKLFVAEMNRRAKALKLAQTTYVDPHGLGKNQSSARDLAALAWHALKDERFGKYVQTRRHQCEVVEAGGAKRAVTWENTNRLLGIDGYDGVKTGTTSAAGSCLIARGRRGDDSLLVVVLGSTSNDGRYADARNLFRWAWLKRGHRDEKGN